MTLRALAALWLPSDWDTENSAYNQRVRYFHVVSASGMRGEELRQPSLQHPPRVRIAQLISELRHKPDNRLETPSEVPGYAQHAIATKRKFFDMISIVVKRWQKKLAGIGSCRELQ